MLFQQMRISMLTDTTVPCVRKGGGPGGASSNRRGLGAGVSGPGPVVTKECRGVSETVRGLGCYETGYGDAYIEKFTPLK